MAAASSRRANGLKITRLEVFFGVVGVFNNDLRFRIDLVVLVVVLIEDRTDSTTGEDKLSRSKADTSDPSMGLHCSSD